MGQGRGWVGTGAYSTHRRLKSQARAVLGMGQGGQGWESGLMAVTHLSLFQKHVEAQERIRAASQALPHSSLLSWAHPPQLGLDQAGEAAWVNVRGSVSRGSRTGHQNQWGSESAAGEGGSTLTFRGTGILTGPWSCPHPIHGCVPEAGSESNCGPGDSPSSWRLSSGSSTCSGPAKNRSAQAQIRVVAKGKSQFWVRLLCWALG